jgi:predicted nucleic acid-binding protein
LTVGVDVFFDTNILIYASNGRYDEPEKHEIASGLLTLPFGVSGQVLAEFYANVRCKGSVPLTDDVAQEWIDALMRKPFIPVDQDVVFGGLKLSQRHKISYWDGAIIAAADLMGAHIVYSEDLNHGQTYGSVRVCNPFIEDFLADA